MHDGTNARVWVSLAVQPGSGADGHILSAGTPFLTRSQGARGALPPEQLDQAVLEGALVFESMHELTLRAHHNEMLFYTWSDEQCVLPEGATQATLRNDDDRLQHLKPGDVLMLQEQLSPKTGLAADADPARRHAVRLTSVVPTADPLDQTPVVEIEWHRDDALHFPLCLSTFITGESGQTLVTDVSVARGNVLLADHGYSIRDTALVPEVVPDQGTYRPSLPHRDITHRVPYDHALAQTQSAFTAVRQRLRAALPAVSLESKGEPWTVRPDLLRSARFAAEFAVETHDDGSASIRFGDGVLGRRPAAGTQFTSTFRLGNGNAGNVGAEAIGHVVTDQSGILDVRNPLPAQGGVDPEPIEQVRLYAPQAFHIQQRAVTAEDYATVAQRHREVQKAVATLRWTGSWHTVFVTLNREGGRPVDNAFKAELRAFLERFRLAGHDLEIDGPRYVPLDIDFTVCVSPTSLRSAVRAALLETFSNVDLPDGRRGFFHPDNLTFGQPVFLSQVVAAAMQVPGVLWVDTDDTPPKRNRFQRYGQVSGGELAAGRIPFDRLEIARLDNDPNAPENGQIAFHIDRRWPMSTSADPLKLNIYSGCEAEPMATVPYNRPGQPELAYRIGTHATFLRRMLANLVYQDIPLGPNQGARPLADLLTRASDDLAIALLDAWAIVADVLTFYQERIANEGYLRTATERRSVLELARAIGYELNPVVAASTFLAFTMEEGPGSPLTAIVAKGTKVQSIPPQGQLPQTFETIETLEAHTVWNRLRPRQRQPQALKPDAKQLYLTGTALNLEAGDLLLVVARDENRVMASHTKRIERVVTDVEQGWTRVELAPKVPPPPRFVPPSEPAGIIDLTPARLNATQINSHILLRTWHERDLNAFLKIKRWDAQEVLDHIAIPPPPPKPSPPPATDVLPPATEGVFVFRQRLGMFGHNAPRWETLPTPENTRGGSATDDA